MYAPVYKRIFEGFYKGRRRDPGFFTISHHHNERIQSQQHQINPKLAPGHDPLTSHIPNTIKRDVVASSLPQISIHASRSSVFSSIMSSRKVYIREDFAAVMRKNEGSATTTPRRVEPSSGFIPRPSHPAFDRLEEMKAKQLTEVSNNLSWFKTELRTTALQDFETLKKGFIKLREKYTQSTATVSALEEKLNVCRGESEQLKTQVIALEERLGAQAEMTANEVTAATSALRTVRLCILTMNLLIEEPAEGALCSKFSVSLPTKTPFIVVE